MTKKNTTKKKFQKTEIVLMIVFILLLILVTVLTIVVINKKADTTPDANMAISLTTKSLENEFSIKLDNLEKDSVKKYTFKVRNYYNNKLNKIRINYAIKFTKPDNVKLSLYKNENDRELLKDALTYEKNTLRFDIKQDDYFELKIKALDKLDENSAVSIKISGKAVK